MFQMCCLTLKPETESMNHLGVGNSPLASRNRLRYIPPNLNRNASEINYDFSSTGDHSKDTAPREESLQNDQDVSSTQLSNFISSDGITTILSTTYSLLIICFFKSLLDRMRPNSTLASTQTSRQASTTNLTALEDGQPKKEMEKSSRTFDLISEEPVQVSQRKFQRVSANASPAETSDILPLDLLGPSITKNKYTNLYESMFEVESSDDEVIDLTSQYGTSLGISDASNYKPKFGNYESTSTNDESLYIGNSINDMSIYNSAVNPLDTINTSSYMLEARKANAFRSASSNHLTSSILDLAPSDEYDSVVSKFYTPFKPVPQKQFSLTDAIMASIPTSSLSGFLRKERECIQDLILNERKAQLSKIASLSPQQLLVVNQYWNLRQANGPIVSAYSIDITVRDLGTLVDGRWLNDNIIDFYLNMVSEKFPEVYCWTTHFFTTMKSKGYQGVARWAKRRKVNVTEKKLVIVPINIMSTHWAVAVIDNDAATISYYDSLASKGNLNAVQLLQQYMIKECERLLVQPKDYTLHPNMKTPQQLNGFDCGVFSCTVAKFISGKLPLTFSQNDMKTIRRRMAYEIINKSLLENASASHL